VAVAGIARVAAVVTPAVDQAEMDVAAIKWREHWSAHALVRLRADPWKFLTLG
jgi:hypothetical protein